MATTAPITIAIAGKEEQVPSIDAKEAATTGAMDTHFSQLNAQLQKIAFNTTTRPVFNNRLSDSNSSQHSDETDDIVLSASATPGLASSIGTPVSDGLSNVATPIDASASYFNGNEESTRANSPPLRVLNIKRAEQWSSDSAYGSELGSRAVSYVESEHSVDEDISPMPTIPSRAKLASPRNSSPTIEEEDEQPAARPHSSRSSTPERERPALSKALMAPGPEVEQSEAGNEVVALSKDWFAQEPATKDLILPSGPSAVEPEQRQRTSIDVEDLEAGAQVRSTVAVEDQVEADTSSSVDSKASIWSRTKEAYKFNYAPTEAPALIMPTAPTDAEKTLYLSTNRLGLYSFGVLSFLSLSVGMWLFVISSPAFYWFGSVVFLLQLYLIISYTVSICGKDYDIEKHRRIVTENPVDENAPTVDIFLPCCKEPIEILENTYKYIEQLEYPEGKLKVWVLDDGADEAVVALAAKFGYNYICREDRPRLKKAGNLRWAFARTEGDFFTIFDADFCPRADFLKEIIPIHLGRPDTAIVQTPQFFRTLDEQTWIEQGAGAVQELFYRVVQVNRNRFGASICVGSNAVYRREALRETGGTAEIGFSEDVHTGFYAINRGWKLRYLPLCLACGICPDTPRAFFSQQMRWCMGSTILLTNMDFWKSNLSPIKKICYLSGMMYYSAIALSIFINPLPGILMLWIRPEYVRYYNLAFAIPSILYSLIALRCWAKASYGFNVQYVMVIQAYAYLMAIKDRVLGQALAWVPSGDTKAHKNDKYRNMRILAICWCTTVVTMVVAGTIYQCLRGLSFYDCLPLLILNAFNLILSHRFLLWNGKI